MKGVIAGIAIVLGSILGFSTLGFAWHLEPSCRDNVWYVYNPESEVASTNIGPIPIHGSVRVPQSVIAVVATWPSDRSPKTYFRPADCQEPVPTTTTTTTTTTTIPNTTTTERVIPSTSTLVPLPQTTISTTLTSTSVDSQQTTSTTPITSGSSVESSTTNIPSNITAVSISTTNAHVNGAVRTVLPVTGTGKNILIIAIVIMVIGLVLYLNRRLFP